MIVEGLAKTVGDGSRRFTLAVPSLTVETGEAVALSGPSGSGKTMLLEILGLLANPGAVRRFVLEDRQGVSRNLAALWQRRDRASLARLRGSRLGFVLQTGGLFGFLDARANGGLRPYLQGRPDPAGVAALLERLGLAEVAALRPEALSIGQRQRVAIVRALAHRPSFVIADEPTSALDPASAGDVVKLLLDLAAERQTAVILSTHNAGLIDRHGLRRLSINRRGAEPGHYISVVEAA